MAAECVSERDGYGNCPLQAAIGRRSFEEARRLLEDGVPVDVKNDDLGTPLTTAVVVGEDEMVRLLLQRAECGADGEVGEKVPVVLALERKHSAVTERLLRHGVDLLRRDKQGRCGLEMLLRGRKEDIAGRIALIEERGYLKGLSSEAWTEWMRIAVTAAPPLPEAVLTAAPPGAAGPVVRQELWWRAVQCGNAGAMRTLGTAWDGAALSRSVHPETGGNVFHALLAKPGASEEAFRFLVGQVGEAVGLEMITVQQDGRGVTALDIFADKPSAAVWKALDEAVPGLDLGRPCGRDSAPLLFAVLGASSHRLDKELPRLLERAGPDAVGWTDGRGNTLLHRVASTMYPDDARWADYLIDRGVDPGARNGSGKTARELSRFPAVSKHLLKCERKRKGRGGGEGGGDQGGLPPPKRLKKEAVPPPAVEAGPVLHVVADEAPPKWTAEGFEAFGDTSRIRRGAAVSGHDQVVAYLRQLHDSVLAGVCLHDGEANYPWLPFVITNASGTPKAALRAALGDAGIALAHTKGFARRQVLFHRHDGEDLAQHYGDELAVVHNASASLKMNLKRLFMIVPGGVLESGSFPCFVGGYWNDTCIAGFVSAFVYT